ncbi:MAG: serine hydrolase [Planctomycetota bacterium]
MRAASILSLVFLVVPNLCIGAAAQTVYYDQTLGFHLGRYATLKPQGYRLVSLDVAGDLSANRWAAVWEQGGGPEWTAAFGLSGLDYAVWRADRLHEGYRDDWITSAGSGLQCVYGGIMIRDSLGANAVLDASEQLLETIVGFWEDVGYLLKSISVHGTAAEPRYAVVFLENPGKIRWGYSKGDTASGYQGKFDAFVTTCRARPAIVTASASQRYASVFYDDHVGEWAAHHDMTKAAYGSTAATLALQGFAPLQIMVAGTGTAARYAALFRRGTPASSQITKTGGDVPAFAAIDDLMVGVASSRTTGFMQQNNARAAGVAITKNGRLVFARGYTWGPPGTQITQPTDGFRLASLSKSIAALTTYHRIQRSRDLTANSRLVDLVDLGTPADPRVNDIRVHHLIDHRSGYNGTWPTDVLAKLAHARATIQTQMLAFAPGSDEDYSNAAYQLLTVALEAETNRSYFGYVRDELMAPLGITRAHLITSAHAPGDAFCVEARWRVSRQLAVSNNFALAGSPLTNEAYAVIPYSMDGSGGLVMSPVDYVRLMSGVLDPTVDTDVLSDATRQALEQSIQGPGRTGGWDEAESRTVNGQTIRAYVKGGLWRSSHTYGVYRTDGVAIAAFCTSPEAPDIDAIQNIVDAVAETGTWPQHDLFPTYGLASYPRRNPGTATPFGTACGAAPHVPAHSSSGFPEVGRSQNFELRRGLPQSLALLNVGLSRRIFNGLPLPLDLAVLGAPGCSLLVGPVLTIPTRIGASGVAGASVQYPPDPGLVGAHLYSQFAMADANANPLGLAYSNGIETRVGQ